MKLLACNSVSICCVIGAIVLMFYQRDGWGWLLLLGFLAFHTYSKKH